MKKIKSFLIICLLAFVFSFSFSFLGCVDGDGNGGGNGGNGGGNGGNGGGNGEIPIDISEFILQARNEVNSYILGWEQSNTESAWEGNLSYSDFILALESFENSLDLAESEADVELAVEDFFSTQYLELRKAKEENKSILKDYCNLIDSRYLEHMYWDNGTNDSILPSGKYYYLNGLRAIENSTEISLITNLCNSALSSMKNAHKLSASSVIASEIGEIISNIDKSVYFETEISQLNEISIGSYSRLNVLESVELIEAKEQEILDEIDLVLNKTQLFNKILDDVVEARANEDNSQIANAYRYLNEIINDESLDYLEVNVKLMGDYLGFFINEFANYRLSLILKNVFKYVTTTCENDVSDIINTIKVKYNSDKLALLNEKVNACLLSLSYFSLSDDYLGFLRDFNLEHLANIEREFYSINWKSDIVVEYNIYLDEEEVGGRFSSSPNRTFSVIQRLEQGSETYYLNKNFDSGLIEMLEFLSSTPLKEGYVFNGWYEATYWHYWQTESGDRITDYGWAEYNNRDYFEADLSTRRAFFPSNLRIYTQDYVLKTAIEVFATYNLVGEVGDFSEFFGVWEHEVAVGFVSKIEIFESLSATYKPVLGNESSFLFRYDSGLDLGILYVEGEESARYYLKLENDTLLFSLTTDFTGAQAFIRV